MCLLPSSSSGRFAAQAEETRPVPARVHVGSWDIEAAGVGAFRGRKLPSATRFVERAVTLVVQPGTPNQANFPGVRLTAVIVLSFAPGPTRTNSRQVDLVRHVPSGSRRPPPRRSGGRIYRFLLGCRYGHDTLIHAQRPRGLVSVEGPLGREPIPAGLFGDDGAWHERFVQDMCPRLC